MVTGRAQCKSRIHHDPCNQHGKSTLAEPLYTGLGNNNCTWQQQEENSPNHVQVLFPGPVLMSHHVQLRLARRRGKKSNGCEPRTVRASVNGAADKGNILICFISHFSFIVCLSCDGGLVLLSWLGRSPRGWLTGRQEPSSHHASSSDSRLFWTVLAHMSKCVCA